MSLQNTHLPDFIHTDDFITQAFNQLYLTLIVDASCVVRYVSKSYAETLGHTPEEMIGQPIKEFLPNSRTDEYLRTGEQALGEVFELPDKRVVMCNYIPVRNEFGEVIAVMVSSTLDISETVENLYHRYKELEEENSLYLKQIQGLRMAYITPAEGIIGKDPVITRLKETVERIANISLPVLLIGETGCGKEVFADALHQISDRRDYPFVKINCAAIPKDLFESELFGYEAGTFSGASKTGKAGKLELANNGSILFDEIEALPLDMQAKLLRVLQEYEVQRIGSVKSIPLNIRIICSTNEDLQQKAAEGLFREDLLYRINVMPIEIPPLRERLNDIPELCDFFLKKINAAYHLDIQYITTDCFALFREYDWPGNVRELQHVLERASVMTKSHHLNIDDFSFLPVPKSSDKKPAAASLSQHLADTEKDRILHALAENKYNKTKTAEYLGISRSKLYLKMKEYGIS